ncbi:hypothetical protein ABT317_00490, partial [Streptomyces carpinensis]
MAGFWNAMSAAAFLSAQGRMVELPSAFSVGCGHPAGVPAGTTSWIKEGVGEAGQRYGHAPNRFSEAAPCPRRHPARLTRSPSPTSGHATKVARGAGSRTAAL